MLQLSALLGNMERRDGPNSLHRKREFRMQQGYLQRCSRPTLVLGLEGDVRQAEDHTGISIRPLSNRIEMWGACRRTRCEIGTLFLECGQQPHQLDVSSSHSDGTSLFLPRSDESLQPLGTPVRNVNLLHREHDHV
jgi:hypothetical protein